jgi:hypothetical protein
MYIKGEIENEIYSMIFNYFINLLSIYFNDPLPQGVLKLFLLTTLTIVLKNLATLKKYCDPP